MAHPLLRVLAIEMPVVEAADITGEEVVVDLVVIVVVEVMVAEPIMMEVEVPMKVELEEVIEAALMGGVKEEKMLVMVRFHHHLIRGLVETIHQLTLMVGIQIMKWMQFLHLQVIQVVQQRTPHPMVVLWVVMVVIVLAMQGVAAGLAHLLHMIVGMVVGVLGTRVAAIVMHPLMPQLRLSSAMGIVIVLVTTQGYTYQICRQM